MSLLVSQGSGATLATEVINSLHFQQIKVIAGASGASTPWNIDTAGAGLTQLNHLTSLASGTNILATQSGNWDVRSLLSLASIYGNVGITGTVAATESGTWTVQPGNTPNTSPWLVTQSGGLISLASGTNVQATQSGNWDVRSLLSLASIYGNVGITGTPTVSLTGLVSLASGTNLQAVQSGTWTVQPGNTANSTPWLVTQSGGLISLASGTLIGLNPSTNFIGLASTVQGFTPVSANYTSFATVISASGAASLFAPPNNQRWILKDLIIGSLGRQELNIQSGGSIVSIPYIALATLGGYIANFGESGFRADALNSAFVVNLKSVATISILANVRFDTV